MPICTATPLNQETFPSREERFEIITSWIALLRSASPIPLRVQFPDVNFRQGEEVGYIAELRLLLRGIDRDEIVDRALHVPLQFAHCGGRRGVSLVVLDQRKRGAENLQEPRGGIGHHGLSSGGEKWSKIQRSCEEILPQLSIPQASWFCVRRMEKYCQARQKSKISNQSLTACNIHT